MNFCYFHSVILLGKKLWNNQSLIFRQINCTMHSMVKNTITIFTEKSTLFRQINEKSKYQLTSNHRILVPRIELPIVVILRSND